MDDVRTRARARLAFIVAVATASALLAAPAFGLNRDGVWKGSTSQDRTIRFEVESHTITSVKLSVLHAPCNLTVVARVRSTAFRIQPDGSFTMRFFGGESGDDRVVVQGEFATRARAKGTFRSVQGNAECQDTVTGTWRAVRQTG